MEIIIDQVAKDKNSLLHKTAKSVNSFYFKYKDSYDNFKELERLKSTSVRDFIPYGDAYLRLSDKDKEAYVKMISTFLDLSADATIDRISDNVARRFDEYIVDVAICTAKVAARAMLDGLAVFSGGMAVPILSVIKYALNFDEKLADTKKKILSGEIRYPVCHNRLKHKYAQEIQMMFFAGM